jgi:GH24 family phage-related lysozyme (muramidase)
VKVPTLTSTRTTSPSGGQQFTQAAPQVGAAGATIARSLGNLGDAFVQAQGVLRQRDDQLTRFNTLRDFSGFETSVANDLTALKRDYAADGKGFSAAANDLYDKLETQFLNEKVSPEQFEEFRAKAGNVKQRVMADAMSFQYQAGDAWYKQGIDDQLNKSKLAIDQNPGALEEQRATMMETIDSTDLPEIEKVNLKRNVNIALEAVTYKVEARRNAEQLGSLGVGPISSGASGAAAILRKEEGFRPTPYWDVNHDRVGYGSDTVTLADGSVQTTTKGMAITRADAERDLERRINVANGQAREKVGAELWDSQPANVQAGVLSVIYNYGHLPNQVATALKSGSTEEVAAAVEGLSSGSKRRAREAAIIRGTATIDADPRFANIPYEDRLALQEDATREAQQAVNAQNAADKAARDAAQNALYLGLLDGNKGQVDIDNARADGTLNDYDSVNKAAKILKDRNEGQDLATSALTKLQTGGAVWDPTSTDDKKMLNALVGKGGLEKIASGDQDYIHDGIVPLVNQTGDIPTDVAGALTGMIRGNNNGQAMFALDALAQLQDTNEVAFNQRLSTDMQQAVDLWQARKDITPREELLSMVRGGTTQQERQARAVLRKEAQDLLSRTEGGIPVMRTLLTEAVEGFEGWFSSANVYTAPVAQQVLQKEFQTQFVDAYSKVGDVEVATTMAQKELARNWSVTSIGGRDTLMKYAPEKVGYKMLGGSYDWIDKQVRTDLGYSADQAFELFSDEQTRQEFQKFKADPNAPAPSYRVFTIDENGVARERLDENGRVVRLNFKAPPEAIAFDAEVYDFRAEQARLEEVIDNYRLLRAGAEVAGKEVPEEDTAEFEAAKTNLDALIRNDPRVRQAREEQKALGVPFPEVLSNFDPETGLPIPGRFPQDYRGR